LADTGMSFDERNGPQRVVEASSIRMPGSAL